MAGGCQEHDAMPDRVLETQAVPQMNDHSRRVEQATQRNQRERQTGWTTWLGWLAIKLAVEFTRDRQPDR
jgi:hypothetical protein